MSEIPSREVSEPLRRHAALRSALIGYGITVALFAIATLGGIIRFEQQV